MTGTNVVDLLHLTQKFPGGPIKFQEISRSCRHPGVCDWSENSQGNVYAMHCLYYGTG